MPYGTQGLLFLLSMLAVFPFAGGGDDEHDRDGRQRDPAEHRSTDEDDRAILLDKADKRVILHGLGRLRGGIRRGGDLAVKLH